MARKTAMKKEAPHDPLKPSTTLLMKLGSAVVHADEMISPGSDPVDKLALEQCLKDPELSEWIAAMTKMALLPVKRNK